MKVNLNFLSPYLETPTGKKEVKTRFCQGCFLWLPAGVFSNQDSQDSQESDYCEECLSE